MRGFEYLMYSAFSTTLLFVLIFLPLAPLFASETVSEVQAEPVTPSDTEESPEEINEPTREVPDESAQQSEEVVDIPIEITEEVPVTSPEESSLGNDETNSDEAVSDSNELNDVAVGSSTESEGGVSTEETPVSPDTEPVSEPIEYESTTTPETSSTDISTTTENVETIPQDPELIVATTTTGEELETVLLVDSQEFIATTSEEMVEEGDILEEVTVEVVEEQQSITVINESSFSFSKDECVSVGGGSFYCSNATTAPSTMGVDRVFSATDGSGDREIYIEKEDALTQITDNTFEDDAPYFDEVSDTLVWHRLIDGRYQIITYDTETGEETQITHDRYNNMEPSRYGGVTVWQGWVGNDWEVMLEENDELTMITDNTVQDVSPRINGNYIIWQSFEEGAWRVKVYDLVTKQTETIADSDGASVDNPRFVLVYDTKHENGDIETKGYDLKSGEVTPLSATPAPIPENIPDPEQTGEERALVAPQTQPKSKTDDDTEGEPLNPDIGDDDDVVVPPFVSNGSSTPATTTLDMTEAEELVVVTPLDAEEATSSVAHIEDVIVPPYVEPIPPLDTLPVQISSED